MQNHNKRIGTAGEQHVADYLARQGFTIRANNFRTKSGEIDLIASNHDVLAFIEVKTRSYHMVEPTSLIPISKQKKIIKTAYAYIAHHNIVDMVYRFDVAFIGYFHGTLTIDYIENAFTDHDV